MTDIPPVRPPETNDSQHCGSHGLAVASLVLGICAFVLLIAAFCVAAVASPALWVCASVGLLAALCGLAAVILGVVSLTSRREGMKHAITGIALGVVGPVASGILGMGFLWLRAPRVQVAQTAQLQQRQANLNAIGQAVAVYASSDSPELPTWGPGVGMESPFTAPATQSAGATKPTARSTRRPGTRPTTRPDSAPASHPATRPAPRSTDGRLHFHCTACGKQFSYGPEDMPMPDTPEEAAKMFGPFGFRLDCPRYECNGPAVQMQRCLKCGELFVSEPALHPERWMNSPEPPRFVCPHCGTDQMRYQEKLLEEQARARTQPAAHR